MASGGLAWAELAVSCPPGGPLGWLGCGEARGLALATLGLAVLLYLVAQSAVLAWSIRVAHPAGFAPDWYVLTGLIGLVIMPLLAFTLVSAFR